MITSGIILLFIIIILFYTDRYYLLFRLKKIGKLIAQEKDLTSDNLNNLIYNNTKDYSKIRLYQYHISKNTLIQLNNNSEELNTHTLNFLNYPIFSKYIQNKTPNIKCFYSMNIAYIFIPNLKTNHKQFIVLSRSIDTIESIFKK